MSFPFKGIGFDWAYTLMDLGKEDDRMPLKKVFDYISSKNLSLPEFEEFLEQMRKIFFPMIKESRVTNREARFEVVLQKLMSQYGIPLSGEITLKNLLEIYYLEVYSKRKLYPEVMPVLITLKDMGVRMGVVSNTTNPGFMKENEMKAAGLKPFFEFAIYSSDTPYRKPHPSIFELAIDNLNMKPEEILFVGDNIPLDVVGAKNVGMKSAWINRARKNISAESEPDYELHSLEDLLRIGSPTP
ncbi:MAG: HAD-IIIA family hydrolase [Nitrospinae bacterium]|nr:HAD-IIIA family hydrolase [Nitrospinota bacterium]